MARPFEGYRSRKLGRVNDYYTAFLSAGFPVQLENNAETLQIVRDRDRTNWLVLLGVCDEAILAGAGDVTIPTNIEVTSGNKYSLTFSQTAEMIRNLRQWAIAANANWVRIKTSVAQAPTRQSLDEIDETEGWP